MKRTLGLAMAAALAVTALTACMGGGDSSARREGRAAALVNATQPGGIQLTISGLTPANKAIDVSSYSWGVAAGRPLRFNDLKITKTMDETSPLLFRGAATGASYRNAELKLHLTSEDGQNVNYLTYTLENVAVTSVQPTAMPGGDTQRHTEGEGLHMEEVSLSYQAITEVVTADPQGSVGPVRFGWDLAAGRETRP